MCLFFFLFSFCFLFFLLFSFFRFFTHFFLIFLMFGQHQQSHQINSHTLFNIHLERHRHRNDTRMRKSKIVLVINSIKIKVRNHLNSCSKRYRYILGSIEGESGSCKDIINSFFNISTFPCQRKFDKPNVFVPYKWFFILEIFAYIPFGRYI